MSREPSSRSEVATLLAQIQREYEAGRSALYDLALGSSQHAFITTRMERMGHLHQELQGLVGETAIALIAQTLEHSSPVQSETASPTEESEEMRNHADPTN